MNKSTLSKTYNTKNTSGSNYQQPLPASEYHSQCVCQICTCHKHRCPHSEADIPLDGLSSYQKQYVRHPLQPGAKRPQEAPRAHQPYGNIASNYQENYPGHKPQMREKCVPRVKNQNKNIPMQGESWYKSQYGPKTVAREKPNNKDKQFVPDSQPFEGQSLYKTDFTPKKVNSQPKKTTNQADFPPGYKFNGNSTYKNDYVEKDVPVSHNYKPVETRAPKGTHDLNTLYRQDYTEKPLQPICPVCTLPAYPRHINYPKQHVIYDKYNRAWHPK